VNLDTFFPSENGVEMTLVWSNAQRERLMNAKHEANNKDDRTLQGLIITRGGNKTRGNSFLLHAYCYLYAIPIRFLLLLSTYRY